MTLFHKTFLHYRQALIKTQAFSVSESVSVKPLSDLWVEETKKEIATEEDWTNVTVTTFLESTYTKLSELTTRLKNWKRVLDCSVSLDRNESKMKYLEWINRHIKVMKEDQHHVAGLVKQSVHLHQNLHHRRYSSFFPSGASVFCSTAQDRLGIEQQRRKVLEYKMKMPKGVLIRARLANKRWKQLSSDWVDQLEVLKGSIKSCKRNAEALKSTVGSAENSRMDSSVEAEKLKVDFDTATKLVHILSYIDNKMIRVERICMQEERALSLDKKRNTTGAATTDDDIAWMDSQDLILGFHRVAWEQIRTLCYLPMVLIKKEKGSLSYSDCSKRKNFKKVRCYLNEQAKIIGMMKNDDLLSLSVS